MHRRARTIAAMLAAFGLAIGVAGCGSDSGSSDANGAGKNDATLTLYNAQHEDLVDGDGSRGFTKETGIKVKLRNGSDFELANQIVQEGDRLARRRLPHRELARR